MKTSLSRRSTVRITVLLVVAIAGFVFLSTGVVLLLSGQAAYHNTWELLRSSGLMAIESVEDEIRDHVKPAEEIAKYISQQVAEGEIDPGEPDELLAALKGTLAAAPQIAGIVLWDKDLKELEILRTKDGKLNIRRKPVPTDTGLIRFINTTRHAGRVQWGTPGHGDGQSYVYVVTPLYHQGIYWGVLATGVTLSNLSSSVDAVGRELGMTGFILYGNQFVLAHPSLDAAKQKKTTSDEVPLPPINKLGDAVVAKYVSAEVVNNSADIGYEVREIEHDDEDYLILSRTNSEFGDVPWHIGIYAPIENLNTQVRRLVGSIAVAILVLIAAVIGAVLLARRIANPIRTLAVAAEQIGRFDLANITPLPRSRIREIDDQATAFNRMLDGLRWFETYVPKTLVTRLITGHQAAAIQSEEMNLTVMFTDIVGFTAMSEDMQPSAVAEMLNDHFEILGRAIEAQDGTLDKYIGDAVMAFWGAPDHQPDHAERACRAALDIARALEAHNNDHADRPPIRIKIALHSGPLLVGNIGARSRMNYTVIGDTVNTCSRIEALCRDFDDGGAAATILVSEDTAKLAEHATDLNFVKVGAFEVKGRNEPVSICRLEKA